MLATQYVANASVRNQLAVPDRYVKACGVYKNCSTNYPAGRNYSATFTPKNTGNIVTARVGDVGPWNEDDNYWDPDSNWPRPRRLFRDLAQGTPEAYAAAAYRYNAISWAIQNVPVA